MEERDNYVNWDVRIEYWMLVESVNKKDPDYFTVHFKVNADTLTMAWALAMEAFPIKWAFDKKVFGVREISVRLDT